MLLFYPDGKRSSSNEQPNPLHPHANPQAILPPAGHPFVPNEQNAQAPGNEAQGGQANANNVGVDGRPGELLSFSELSQAVFPSRNIRLSSAMASSSSTGKSQSPQIAQFDQQLCMMSCFLGS